MILVLDALALVVVALTLLSLIRSARWWVRIWDYPRAQIALVAVACGTGVLVWSDRSGVQILIAATALGCALYQSLLILPYTPLVHVQSPRAGRVPRERRIRILLANVLMDNRQADGLLAMIEREAPDVVLAVETDDYWDERLRPVAGRLPHTCHEPLPNTYGLHFFTSLETRGAQIRHLVEPDIPSIRTDLRLGSGDWITFIGVHPKPPQPAQDVDERDAELVLTGREAREAELPVIVAGDLNDVAWSHTTRLFQRISGLLDPRVGRGLFATFHARIPLLRWPLDHLFHDPQLTLVELRRLGYFGSDHFPVLVELALEPDAARAVDRPAPEPGDHREARRMLGRVMPKLRARMRAVAARRPRLRRRKR